MIKKINLIILSLLFVGSVFAQTVKDPVVVELMNSATSVSPGSKSYVIVQFKVPKGIWMGAESGDSRVPPATVITPEKMAGFNYEEPMFPEPIQEWVPAKLGKTLVYKELVKVVVPYTVSKNVKPGNYDLKFKITYSPGYSAGKLSTHVKDEHSINIKVANNSETSTMPKPSLGSVPDDFVVSPKSYDDVPKLFRFIFKPLNEDGAFVKGLHKIWLDKEGHGKQVRLMPFPNLSSTNITGSSTGMGLAFFNSTKEGTMTGNFSFSGFYNDLIGGGFGISAISCPGAYHNYQFNATFGGESYRDVQLHYENFTIADSKVGINFSTKSIEEPRKRFNGIGNNTFEVDETAYRQTLLNAALDLYSVGIQNFRFGVGASYDNYDVGTSFDKIRTVEGIEFLEDTQLADNLIGIDGNTIVGLKANFIFDHKDQEFASGRGFYSKLTISRNEISDTEGTDLSSNYYGLKLDVSQYFSGPYQKLVILMRGGLELKSQGDIPFYAQSSLGGPNSMRAYDFDRFLGQHAAFASAEMRYTLFSLPVLGYPMDIELGAFLDVGQIFGGVESLALGDDLKVDPGMTMRMINKPNVGLVFSIADGDDGLYFTGGIGLPF
ncbi:outer membrane protein assembly factor [Saprospiraceae bacterium]|nr:outer membrane protein assembly factor [Saprospiraceae bacterium]